MPTTTLRPSNSFSAGLAASTSSDSASCWFPKFATSAPFLRSSVASSMFIAGLPMKPADEEVHRMVVQLLRLGHLLQFALAHDRDTLAHRHRLDLVVGDVDRRHAEVVLDLADLRAHLHAKLGVEVRERLVHQERGRLAHDRSSHRHALSLTARELPAACVSGTDRGRGCARLRARAGRSRPSGPS